MPVFSDWLDDKQCMTLKTYGLCHLLDDLLTRESWLQ